MSKESKQKSEEGFDIKFKDMEKFLEKYQLKQTRSDFVERAVLLIIAALGFITALAWDQALKLIFLELFNGLETVAQKILYALLLTIMAAFLSVWLSRLFLKKKK